MKGCYSSLLLILLLISVYGCLEGGGSGVFVTDSIGTKLVEDQRYTNLDRSIATKICYAFQSKRSNFVNNYNGESFNFDLNFENFDCDFGTRSERIETTLVATTLSGTMIYDTLASTDEFERNIQTNSYGYLINICSAIMRGDEMPDKVQELGTHSREVISFYETNGEIGFTYQNYERDWSQTKEEIYLLKNYDYMTVLVDQSDEKYGIVLERVRGKECSNNLVEKKSQFYLP